MKRLRILFADDEIPYGDDRDAETKKLLMKRIDGATEEDYEKGRRGMANAMKALHEAGMDPIPARTCPEAIDKIRKMGWFDVAIIDLGWMGDPKADNPETAGWALLDALRETERGRQTPVIMYSNRFDRNGTDSKPTLAHSAVDLDTLPLPKTYTDGSHQTLIAAVRFLARPTRSRDDQLFSGALERWERYEGELNRWSKICRGLLILVGIVLVFGVAAFLFRQTDAETLQVISSVLIGSFLAYATSQMRSAAEESRKAMQDAERNAKRSQQEETPAT